MDHKPDPFLLPIWRGAAQSRGIQDFAEEMAHLLATHLALERLLVFAFEPQRGGVALRAWGPLDTQTSAPQIPIMRAFDADTGRAFRDWVAEGTLVRRQDRSPLPRITDLLPQETLGRPTLDHSDWLAIPLSRGEGATGILLLQARAEESFTTEHTRLASLLLEPFSVALDNDQRLQDLTALREAAEADQRSVLSRIGRDDLVETIIGEDGGLGPVMERVALVAGSDVPVLILGETGSGKEVIARAIHERSPRSRGPFVRVNCGAIPGELIDSELFGHEKGAFTGATATRRGWFERADEGTLLLDEIGELPLPAQVRLLRVLQEGTFERVGGERSIRVDVRIVAATHRDLPGMVQRGRFREDLWYRITGFPILLPPLRERKEDIPALAEHFVERAARRFGLRPLALSKGDLGILEGYAWPGNIRELASVIDRAAILGAGESLEVERALGGTLRGDASRASPTPDTPSLRVEGGTLPSLGDAMRRHIEAALVRTRGQIEGERGAARLLDINPHTLRSRMRKLEIDWTSYR